jgi:hypothetical protein
MKKSIRVSLPALLLLLGTVALAQSDAPKAQTDSPKIQTEAQKSFAFLKTLAGSWEGPITTSPETPAVAGKAMRVWLRETSRGNAVLHEMKLEGIPDDPITMFYLDDGRLLLTHYCDAGNRPRMAAKASADGKTLAFDFIDITGNTQRGHMHRAVITAVDANHHIEEWTLIMPGDQAVTVRMDLRRTTEAPGMAAPGSAH